MKITRIIVIVILTLASVLFIRKYAFEPVFAASGSMEPTLYKGHRLILDKLTYRFREPRRGEIISFRPPTGEAHGSIKRVIAVEGDNVEIRNKTVYLNGEPLIETYAEHTRRDEILDGDNLGPLTVPPDSLFVLGDNRDNSNDSSVWKDPATGEKIYFLPLSSVSGKIRGIY